MSVDYIVIGRRIRELRKASGCTQAILASKCEISTSFMGHIERGSRIASLETLVKISNELRVSLDGLVLGLDGPVTSIHTTKKMRILNDIMRVLNEHSDEWLRGGEA